MIPTTLIIFGATGDLAKTKLFPSLYHLDKNGLLPNIFNIVAVGRKKLNITELLAGLETYMIEKYPHTYSKDVWQRFSSKITYYAGNFEDENTYLKLAEHLGSVDSKHNTCAYKIFYMAVSPDLFEVVAKGIKHAELNQTCTGGKPTKIIVEKPFGKSLESFKTLNAYLLQLFNENQIYRIDHLLGKETVQNILYFRLANSLLDPNLDAKLVDSIEIKYLESNGIGTRGAYFDSYGQLRDMLQSHMLQLFATTFMDIPESIDPKEISSAKVKMLNSLKISNVVRAQYTEGVINGKKVNNYLNEPNVSPTSMTETFVRLDGVITNDTWNNTKISFVSGKALSTKITEVVVNYKKLNKLKTFTSANKLIFRIQPEEGITLIVKVKKPGQDEMEDVRMSFKFNESFPGLLGDAYEAILLDLIKDRNLFSITTNELEASWQVVDPILKAWETDSADMKKYPAGSDEMLI